MKDWLPVLGVIGAAIIAGLAAAFGNVLLFRRTGQELGVKARQVQVSADQVLVEQTKAETDARAELRASFEAAIEMQNGVIANLDAHVKRLATDVQECQAREALKDQLIHALGAQMAQLQRDVDQLRGAWNG